MTWAPRFQFSTVHEQALRRICNNPDFLEDMETVVDSHKLNIAASEGNERAFQQFRNAFQAIPALIADLSAALDIMAGNCHLSEALCDDNAPVFIGQIKNDLLRIQTTATRAADNICTATRSTARVRLRVDLAKSVERVLDDFGIIATTTRGGSWDICTQIILEACGEIPPVDCTNYARTSRKT